MVTTQWFGSGPAQAPDQPPKTEFDDGAATRAIWLPAAKTEEQLDPQSMPAGFDITRPPPVPEVLTLSSSSGVNVALTIVAAFMRTVHVAATPLHPPPDHPLNTAPLAGDAVNVTLVPGA